MVNPREGTMKLEHRSTEGHLCPAHVRQHRMNGLIREFMHSRFIDMRASLSSLNKLLFCVEQTTALFTSFPRAASRESRQRQMCLHRKEVVDEGPPADVWEWTGEGM